MHTRAITAVNQFHSGTAVGDAVTSDMLAMQRALTQAGFRSHIFAEYITPTLQDRIESLNQYEGDPGSLLIVHHSFGINCLDQVLRLPDRKILKYHNITPPHLLPNAHLKAYAELGREQLATYRDAVEIALGDSDYNRRELVELGFRYTGTLPIFYTPSTLTGELPDKSVTRKLRGSFNVLFVGRICPNKAQLELVRIFHHYRKEYGDARLFLVGSGEGCQEYVAEVRDEIAHLGLTGTATLTGKVSDAELAAYYRGCDVLACVSEHEGFCVPLLEAMSFELPVVAYAAAAVPETLGGAGILLDSRDPELWSQVFHELRTNPEFKAAVVAGQRKRLESFRIEDSGRKLLEIINGLGCSSRIDSSQPSLQIQGPFETSYSLASVNRNLALALQDAGEFDVSIHCTEGPGDYIPKESDLADKPTARWLWRKSLMLATQPDIVIRNLYPPRVNDSPGKRNFAYLAWEDSLLPREWAEDFNRSLNGMLAPTRHVEHVLRSSGVTVPIYVVGEGIEESFFEAPPSPTKLGFKRFVFLNVSSGFPRKGLDVLLRAYFEEFNGDDDVTLVLKTFPNIHNDIAQQLAARRQHRPNPPDCVQIDRDIPPDELRNLYANAGCFVYPTRAEGFGLPIAEAMSCKVPVIVTGYSGHMDFCSEENAFLIPYRLVPSQSHLTVPGAEWAEPDVEVLRRQMRFVFEHRDSDEVQRRVEGAYIEICDNVRWAKVAERVQEAVTAGLSQSTTKLAMVSTWDAKCGIAEYSRYFIDAIRAASPQTEVEVLASPGDAVWPPTGVPSTICWNLRPAWDLSGLRAAILRNGYDVVHFQFNFGFFELEEFAHTISELTRAGKRAVITFHSTADLVQDNRLITLRSIAKSLREADLLLVHSEADRERLASFGILENVALLPHGNVVFPQIDRSLRKEWGIPFDPVIGTFGFLLPHKGMLELLESLKLLQRDYPNVGLLAQCALHRDPISANFEQVVRRRIDELGVRDRVLLSTEFVEPAEAGLFLQLADIIVLPYHSSVESSSAAVRFALGAGRPVITTAGAIFSDVAGCTYQVPSNRPEELARAIKTVLGDSAMRERLSAGARECAESTSWPRVGRMYLKLLEDNRRLVTSMAGAALVRQESWSNDKSCATASSGVESIETSVIPRVEDSEWPRPQMMREEWKAEFSPTATQEDIYYCFRLLLGRNPLSTEWSGHSGFAGEPLQNVVRSYLNSAEFQDRHLIEAPLGNIEHVQLSGFSMYASRDDAAVGKHLIGARMYEPHVTAAFQHRLRSGMCVVDIGANIGYFSMLAASLVGATGAVYSFEPGKDNLRLLHASKRLNHFEQVTIVPAAADLRVGVLSYSNSFSNGFVQSVANAELDRLLSTELVPALKVDDLVPRERRVDLIKVDTEGYEFNALTGAIEILRKDKPVIVAEFSPPALKNGSEVEGREFLQFLLDLGYKLTVLDGGQAVICVSDAGPVLDYFEKTGADHIDILAE